MFLDLWTGYFLILGLAQLESTEQELLMEILWSVLNFANKSFL